VKSLQIRIATGVQPRTSLSSSGPLGRFCRSANVTGPAIPDNLRASWDYRRPERHLLLGCLFCIGVGFLLVLGSAHADDNARGAADVLPLGVYALSLATVHLVLVVSGFRGDQILVASAAFLSGFGLLAQTRMGAFQTADGTAIAHFLFPAGVFLMLAANGAFMRGRFEALAAAMWGWAVVSLLLVMALLVTGQRFRGGVYAAGFITPTELLKVTVVLFAAAFIVRYAKPLGKWTGYGLLPPWKDLVPLAAFWAALVALLLVQRDLGMIVILSVTLLVMLVMGTGRKAYMAYALTAAVGLGHLVLGVFQHGQRRIQAWQSPFQDPTGDGWQILQGLSGMHSGGLWGEGFGEGKPEYTPIAESDFIYSVIGEELGFVGCGIVVAFFLLLLYRGLQITHRSRSPFGRLLCGGLVTVMATQTFLNIGGVTKLIPLTGITLPFISHGGSSLLTGFAALGLMLAVSDGGSAKKKPPRRQPSANAGRRKTRPAPSRTRKK
jgi:cell division protein FtsW (lipid II flippase)